MGQKLIITEDEKKRILNLYEQDVVSTETPEGDLIELLKNKGFKEKPSSINTWEIKDDMGTFAATLVLNQDQKTIKNSTIVASEEIMKSIQDIFEKNNIPVVVTNGKLVNRVPFDNKEVIEMIANVVSTPEY